jgi:hypothetical protein
MLSFAAYEIEHYLIIMRPTMAFSVKKSQHPLFLINSEFILVYRPNKFTFFFQRKQQAYRLRPYTAYRQYYRRKKNEKKSSLRQVNPDLSPHPRVLTKIMIPIY